jgi:hypothetical protein
MLWIRAKEKTVGKRANATKVINCEGQKKHLLVDEVIEHGYPRVVGCQRLQTSSALPADAER